jgi:Secretion system C-terminal sorting domain
MKKIHTTLLILCALILGTLLPSSSQACHNSGLTLNSVTSLGGGQYEINMTFAAGAGRSSTQYGAAQNTGTYGFVVSGATVVSYPASLVSPNTAATFTAYLEDDSVLVYDNPTEWWTCIDWVCGPIASIEKDITIVTNGLPSSIVCLALEGAGNPNGGCMGPDVTVYPRCGNFNITASADLTLYPGSPSLSCADISASTSGASGTPSYLWSTGATTSTINVCPSVTTTYSVTATDGMGCTVVESVVVTAIPCSNLIANAGADKNVYPAFPAYSCTNITASASGGSGSYSYLWSTGATTTTINVCPAVKTTYTVTVTDLVRGCVSTDDVIVDSKNISCGSGRVNVCYGGRTRCATLTQAQNFLNVGGTLGACGSSKSAEEFDGMGAEAAETSLEVGPNPADEHARIFVNLDASAQVKISLYDINGREVKTIVNGQRDAGSFDTDLDVSDLTPGLYILRMQQGDQAFTRKLTVQ